MIEIKEEQQDNAAVNKEEVEKFKGYFKLIKRAGAQQLLEWLEENGFFTAPASTKYHGNYAGGLVEHSNRVFERLSEMFPQAAEAESMAIAGLLHDVCKIDAYKVETKKQKNAEGKWEDVKGYTYTNAFPFGHGEKSVFLIMRFMQLTFTEALAIRWHMGAFDHATKGGSYDMNNALNQCELAAALHIADMTATHIDER